MYVSNLSLSKDDICNEFLSLSFKLSCIYTGVSLNDRGPISKSFEESALRHHADSACRVYTLTLNRKSLDTRVGQSSLKGSAYCQGEGKSDISSKTLSNMYLWVTECFSAQKSKTLEIMKKGDDVTEL